jgi:predicted membrane channel-forming protein YqfA (hemolysin III family)
MRLPSLLSLIGFIILIAATYCPMLSAFGLVTMNVYKMNQPFGLLLLMVGIIGILCTFFNQTKVTRFTAFMSLGLAALLLLAAFLKVKTSFSFIPFKGIAAFLTSKIRFRWGWIVLFGGPLLAVTGALASKTKLIVPPKETTATL